ncbi:hypothetical protein ACE193_14760 [Bernardetia sp. OM2101]|uniref:hypothetical protein n=1 Tax=Bernardetia sp. OM2101 TaxID=3344876 RepID=UPI0035CFBA60
MKFYTFLISLIFISCSLQKNENKIIAQEIEKVNTDSSKLEIAKKRTPIQQPKTWEEKQDSIRNTILKSKPNATLKSNFFQEFYIKGFVKQVDDKIEFDLPFDLHSFDCGAPDCYSTKLNFTIPAKKPVKFPKQITCVFLEKGCDIENEISKK